jgi:hypothetical protein
MASSPALEPVQPRADGANRYPAVEAVSGLARVQETAVSDQGSPQEAPEGHPALQSGLLAGEVAKALL